MYRALIVENESEDADRLSGLVGRYSEARHVRFHITRHASAMEMLSDKSHYDLCFLDIDLPGISGMDAAQLLRVYDQTTPLVFVTNLAKYAVRGYEVDALGFIVKPATYGNVAMNLDRVLRALSQNSGRSVMVPTEDGVRVIALGSIVFVEVMGHRLTYHLEGEKPLEARGSLGQLEEELTDAPIVRVSKSCLANMDKVSLIRNDYLQMSSGDRLRVSRTRKREVMDTVTDYLGGRR